MKTLYLDCSMGAAGDMLTAALLELHEQPEAVLDTLNRAFDGKAVLSVRKDQKCGISGSHVTVTIDGQVEGEEPLMHTNTKASTAMTADIIMSTSITMTTTTVTRRSPMPPRRVPMSRSSTIITITIPPSPRSGRSSAGSTSPRMSFRTRWRSMT